MNEYALRFLARERMSELLREAEHERLARRVRVRRDGSVGFARKLVSAIQTGLGQVAGAAAGPAGSTAEHSNA